MSFVDQSELIARIHAASTRLVLAVTGGGSGAVSALLRVPGASRTLLAATIPYCAAAMDEWLEAATQQYCSARTARAMAMKAYCRAVDYTGGDHASPSADVAGVGCTASLASDRPKRGAHRFHVALQSDRATQTWSVELQKGGRSRAAEEEIAATCVLNAVAEACGVAERLDMTLGPADHLETVHTLAPPAWQALFVGTTRKHLESQSADDEPAARAIFPGAFDPLHEGHREMARAARELLGWPIEYEISITNVDKPPLDFTEMRRRSDQFHGKTLWLTREAKFEEKARLFPGATFVVGADTITRVADPHYYDGGPSACHEAIEEITALGCRFLVFGRSVDGEYLSADQLRLPPPLAALCQRVPEQAFRRDVSSTDIRAAKRE